MQKYECNTATYMIAGIQRENNFEYDVTVLTF